MISSEAKTVSCVACDPASFTDTHDFGEIRVPTAAVESAAWTGNLSRSPERFPLSPRDKRVTLEGDARVSTETRWSAKEKRNETVKSFPDMNTEARLCELEGRMALAAAELELDRERRDERRAATSPGAENRRRRRRERAEVAAKLDATEARLSAMRLEDARKARARLAEAEEDTASLSLNSVERA
jgi:hypothetical protein